ncbi:MAG: hypothetical protein A2428_10085 [Bdellovibrionales bacterium RIFOXYC1_FULL_54_43]|nr:MAG: hypothetical protein A2428_10085 [Bdellovibrionales bacterium RIFOXYC1_FULL_54_43]OFZ80532.1 MAG: hypothetical protein A2603_13180 [Bdellovibrionales bacterium RIFOXYD1_FULL_55_31]
MKRGESYWRVHRGRSLGSIPVAPEILKSKKPLTLSGQRLFTFKILGCLTRSHGALQRSAWLFSDIALIFFL